MQGLRTNLIDHVISETKRLTLGIMHQPHT